MGRPPAGTATIYRVPANFFVTEKVKRLDKVYQQFESKYLYRKLICEVKVVLKVVS